MFYIYTVIFLNANEDFFSQKYYAQAYGLPEFLDIHRESVKCCLSVLRYKFLNALFLYFVYRFCFYGFL